MSQPGVLKKKKFVEIDPAQLLSDIVSSGFDLTQFRQINETGIEQPLNFLDWILGRNFCNASILPWQLETGMKLFADYCPVCSNPAYLNDLYDETIAEIRDNVVFLEDGKCPECHLNRLELFTLGVLNQHKPSIKNELTVCCGQRSGKSLSVALYSSYQLNRWLSIPDPILHYDMPRMAPITGTFSAITADQAEINLWSPFKNLYDQAPWFDQYNKFLKAEEKRLSIPIVEVKETYIAYRHKNFVTNYTGSDDRTKRGQTRLWGAVDEIAFMNTEANAGSRKKIMDADKNYEVLSNSLATLRKKAYDKLKQGSYNTTPAIMYNASSPQNVQDKIMRLVKEAPLNPWAVAVHKATWELNTDYENEAACRAANSGISQQEFDKNFGAVPPFSDSPFIDIRSMEKLCHMETPSPIIATPAVGTDAMGDRYLYLETRILRPDKATPRMMSLDMGYKQNAFGVTIFRYDSIQRKPVLDFAISLSPQPDHQLLINFPMMFESFILPVIKALRIENVFYDRWQSIDQIQRLRDMKVDAQAHSLNFEKDFLPFKQQLLSGNMILPKLETELKEIKESSNPLQALEGRPIATLVWQSVTVRQAGKKILKPLAGDDDLFRAFVLGGSRFLDEDVKKKYATLGGVAGSMGRHVGGFVSRQAGLNQGITRHPGTSSSNFVLRTSRSHKKR